jgi:hypothetical protein
MPECDPGSSLRGVVAALNWQIRQAKTLGGRRHLEAALREVKGAMVAEGDGPQGSRRSSVRGGKPTHDNDHSQTSRKGRVY